MKFRVLLATLLPLSFASAAPTPQDAPLPEDKETTIEVEYTGGDPAGSIPVFGGSKDVDAAKGVYHYKVYVPKGYSADPARRWPCMFITNPGGNAGMGAMALRLKAGGYVVVMLQEAKNGPWAPIVGNFLAAHDDVVKRLRIQEGLKFATGFSGGARASSVFVQVRPGFSGILCQGAGFAYPGNPAQGYHTRGIAKIPGFAVAAVIGQKDSNLPEIAALKRHIPASARFRSWTNEAGHAWASAEQFSEMLDWVEQQVFLEAPTRPDLKPAYTAHFARLAAAAQSAASTWERYQRSQEAVNFARARGLSADPAIAPQAQALAIEVQRLRADPAVSREALATEAWKRLQDSFRGQSADRKAREIADFLKRYPGTQAAAEAEKTGAAEK